MTERDAHEVLATNLHRIMFERNLTLEAIARAAGITPERLRDICSGTFDPELVLVRRIAGAVGVPMSTLFAEPDYN